MDVFVAAHPPRACLAPRTCREAPVIGFKVVCAKSYGVCNVPTALPPEPAAPGDLIFYDSDIAPELALVRGEPDPSSVRIEKFVGGSTIAPRAKVLGRACVKR